MYDTPKAAHFIATDHAGRRVPFNDARGLRARWLAAGFAEAAGIDLLRIHREPKLADLIAVMEACSKASAQTGLRVRLLGKHAPPTGNWRKLTAEPATEAIDRKDFACKVCGNYPDEDGMLNHGRGCYTQSEDGGGKEFIEEAVQSQDGAGSGATDYPAVPGDGPGLSAGSVPAHFNSSKPGRPAAAKGECDAPPITTPKISDLLKAVNKLTHERNALAEGIHDAAVVANLIEPQSLTGPQLLLAALSPRSLRARMGGRTSATEDRQSLCRAKTCVAPHSHPARRSPRRRNRIWF